MQGTAHCDRDGMYVHITLKLKPKLDIIQAVRMLSRCITGDALAVKIMLYHQQCGTNCTLFTGRKRSLGQGNIFTPVCHSVHRGKYLTRYPLGPGTAPRPGTPPWDQVHPLGPGTPPWDQVHSPGTRYTPQTRSPLGPGTPQPGTPRTRFTPWTRYTPPGPGNPPG